jgi:Holliday junction resolvase-like predicted endonuclease
MNDPSPHPVDPINLAEQDVLAAGMKVLDRRWKSGGHALDIVAEVRGRILVVVQVNVAKPGDDYRDITDLSDERVRELRDAAQAWILEHEASYEEIRVDIAAHIPYKSTFTSEYIEDVG